MEARIMYIENKAANGISGPARIGRVTFSRSGRSLYYRGKQLQRIKGFKSNYIDIASGEQYWISGCKKSGGDRLYGGTTCIDEDVREEHWVQIRGLASNKRLARIEGVGKYGG